MKKTAVRSLPLLIVEDSTADFETNSHLLRQSGLNGPLIHCRSGEDAVEYVASVKQKAKSDRHLPAHILVDLNLPGISGLEVSEELRGDWFEIAELGL